MHFTLAPGIYVIGGKLLTDPSDGMVLLIELDEGSSILVGCGSGNRIDALLRNIVELGMSLSTIKYIVIPLVDPSIVNGCRALIEILRPKHVVAPPTIAKAIYQGIGVEPAPISLLSDNITMGRSSLKVVSIASDTAILEVTRVTSRITIVLTRATSLKHLDQIRERLRSLSQTVCRLCLYDECMCKTIQV